MTIAHKTKSKVPKVIKKYGFDLCFQYKEGAGEKNKSVCFGSSASLKNRLKERSIFSVPERDIAQLLLTNLRIGRMSMLK